MRRSATELDQRRADHHHEDGDFDARQHYLRIAGRFDALDDHGADREQPPCSHHSDAYRIVRELGINQL